MINKTDSRREPSSEPVAAFQAEPVLRPRQQVESQIKRAILSGVFREGERLPSETKLAEEFSVSRATVREALRALAEHGLITKTAGSAGGSFVEYVDHHALSTVLSDRLASTLELGSITYEEVAGFRDLLEIPSARLAAAHRTEDDLAALDAVVDREKRASVADPEVPELNVKFHTVLADAAGNRVLAAAVSALHRVARPLAFIDTSPEVGRDAVRHHLAIVAGVRAGDAEAAAEAMRRHLDYLRVHAA